MSDFERSGMMFDEPAKRRSPGTWFSDLGDRLSRGFNNFDRPQVDEDESEWEEYDEPDQPTAKADPVDWDPGPPSGQFPGRRRFPTAPHGYDREAVDAHLAELEDELADLRVRRVPPPSVEAELERVGEETSAILKVAHEQAAEITRRAQTQADRCVSDAAANAVSMTEDAKRKLRQLDSETDAVWAERGRLIEDVRSVATALFSLAEDAADRFPEEGDRRAAPEPQPVMRAAAAAPAAAPPASAPARSASPASPPAHPNTAPQAAQPARSPAPSPGPAAQRPANPVGPGHQGDDEPEGRPA
ncbi:MAG TPA: hypothetical protein VMF57_09525 [Solirubrobacteraceae bacterium]|nr:hypothetical protein [Solirubrobacteraceae bacterium]